MTRPLSHPVSGLTLVVALGAMLLGASAQAEIYQYKDENGKTVFSERPPPKGAEAKVIKPKTGRTSAGAAEKLQQDRERIIPPPKAADATAEKQQAELTPEQLEQKAQACEQAQQALALLRENNRPRYETEDGQIAHMSEEMQASRIADAEEKVSKYCN